MDPVIQLIFLKIIEDIRPTNMLTKKPGISGEISVDVNGQRPDTVAPASMAEMALLRSKVFKYKVNNNAGPNELPSPDQAYKTKL